MKVYINGTETPLVIQGVTLNEEVSDNRPLDSMTFKYISYTNSEGLKPTTLLRITASVDHDKYMLVANDNVEKHSKIVNAYIHTVNAIECTSYLEKFQMSNPTFTLKEWRYTSGGIVISRPTTMLDYLNFAIANAELLSARTCRFHLSVRVLTEFVSVPSEDFFFTSNTTLRDVLDAMFATKGYRAYINKIEDFNDIEIDVKSLAPKGQQVTFKKIVAETNQSDSLYHYGKTVADLKNAISTEILASHGWDHLRQASALNTIVDQSHYGVANLLPIQEVRHFYMKCLMTVEETSISTPPNSYYVIIDLCNPRQIADFGVIDKELYDLMTGNKQRFFIPYERKTRKFGDQVYQNWIGINDTKWGVLKTKFNTIYATYDANYPDTAGMDVVGIEVIYEETPGFLENNANWRGLCHNWAFTFTEQTLLYKIEYVPYIEGRVTASHPTIKDATVQYSNQGEQNLSIERYGKNLQRKVNQSGNNLKVVDNVAFDLTDVHEIGDYDKDNYVITSREIQFGKGFYKCHYSLTKNYLNSQLKASIARDKRLYDIPLDAVWQDLNLIDYIVLSTTQKTSKSGTFYGEEGLKAVLDGFNSTSHALISKIASVTSASQSLNITFIIDATRFTFGRSVCLLWQMFDNYSFDLGVAQRIIGGRAIAYNPYVNKNDGTIHVDADTESRFTPSNEKSWIYLSGVTSDQNGDIGNRNMAEWFDNNEGADSASLIVYYKDPFVALRGVIQAEFVSNEDKIIIGSSIAKYTNLWQDMSNVTLYLYANTDLYTYQDEECQGESVGAISVTVSTTDYSLTIDLSSLPSNAKSYAIGTANKEMLFAVNDTTINKIYFSIVRER